RLEALFAQRADPGADALGRVRRQPDHRRDHHRDGVRLARHRAADLRGGDLPRLPLAAGDHHPQIDPDPWHQPGGRHSLRLCRSAHPAGMTRRVPWIPIFTISIMVAMAIFAPALAPYSPIDQTLRDKLLPPFWVDGGSMAHI